MKHRHDNHAICLNAGYDRIWKDVAIDDPMAFRIA
jgi:hypothetical protein